MESAIQEEQGTVDQEMARVETAAPDSELAQGKRNESSWRLEFVLCPRFITDCQIEDQCGGFKSDE